MTDTGAGADTISAHEAEQISRANQDGRTPVVFIHGLWLLASSSIAFVSKLPRPTSSGSPGFTHPSAKAQSKTAGEMIGPDLDQ